MLFIGFYLSTYKKSPVEAVRKAEKAEIPTATETSEKATEVFQSAKEAVVDAVCDQKTTTKI